MMGRTRKSCRRSRLLVTVVLMFPIIITFRDDFEVHAASMLPNTIVRRTSARKGRRIQADKNKKNVKVDKNDDKNKNANINNNKNNNKNNNNKNNNKNAAKSMPPTSRPTSRYSAPPSSRPTVMFSNIPTAQPTSECRGKLSDVVNFHNGFFSRRAYVQYVQDQCPELKMKSDKFSHLPSTLVQTYWETVCTVQNDNCRVDNAVSFSDLVGVTNNALTGSSDFSVLSRLCYQVDDYCNTITKGPTPSPTVTLSRKPSPSPTAKPTTSPTLAPTGECRSSLSDAVDNHNGYFSKQAYVDFIQSECNGITGLEKSEGSDHAFTQLPQGAVQIYWQTVCAIQNSDCGIDTLIPFTDMVNADLTSNTQTSDEHQTVIARLCHQVKDMCIEATTMTDLPTLSTSSAPSTKPTDEPTQNHTDYPTNQEVDQDPQNETVPPIQITQTPTATPTANPTGHPTKPPTLSSTSTPSKDALEKPTLASTPSIMLAPKVEISFSMFIFEADESENEDSIMSGGLAASSSIKPLHMSSLGLGVPSNAEEILEQSNKSLVQSVLSSLATVLCEETDYIIMNLEGGSIFHDHCSGRRNIEGLATMQHQTVFITDFLGGLFDDMLQISNRRVLSLDKDDNDIYIDWTVWTIKYPVLIQNTSSVSEKSRSYEKSSTVVMTNIQKAVDRVVTSALRTGKFDKELNEVHKDAAFFAASPIGLEVETFEQMKILAEEVNPPIGIIEPDGDTKEKDGYSFFHAIRIVGFIFLALVVGVFVQLVKAGRKNKEAMFHVDEAPAAAREVNLATNEGLDLMLQTSHLGSRRELTRRENTGDTFQNEVTGRELDLVSLS